MTCSVPEDGYASWSEGITEELTEVMASDQSMDMIVVLPTFDEENDFRTVLQAVTENVDEDYRTLADSAHRAAAGVGVGGYMAYIAGLTDAQTGEALTSPSTYGLLASIRGDFVSDANPENAFSFLKEDVPGVFFVFGSESCHGKRWPAA